MRKPSATGVSIERRTVLGLSAAALVAKLARVPPAHAGTKAGSLTWAEFVEDGPRQAKALLDAGADQDAYVLALAGLAVRLAAVPESSLAPFGRLEPAVSFGPAFRGSPFVVIEWRMAPGAVLPPHCHPEGSVCTLLLEGSAVVRNFDVAPGAPAPGPAATDAFDVVLTHEQLLSPRRVNTLTATRDNVHAFEAGRQGARGIDISTLHGEQRQFSFLKIDPQPKEPRGRAYRAVWTGQDPTR